MFILYIANTIIFDAIGPLFILLENFFEDHEYDNLLTEFEWIKGSIDFLSCLCILYILHCFGPYKQYLRKADLLSTYSKQSTAKTLSSAGMLTSVDTNATKGGKRISTISMLSEQQIHLLQQQGYSPYLAPQQLMQM